MGDQFNQLSGYRYMWMLVMFDLPVGSKQERREASAFRHFLLDQGFEMAQFSVYMRCCPSKDHTRTYTRRIEAALPPGGKVSILYFTDKQYEQMHSYFTGSRQKQAKNPSQFVLF